MATTDTSAPMSVSSFNAAPVPQQVTGGDLNKGAAVTQGYTASQAPTAAVNNSVAAPNAIPNPGSAPASTTRPSTSSVPSIPGYTLSNTNSTGAQQVYNSSGQLFFATPNAAPVSAGTTSAAPQPNASGPGGISSSSSLVTSANGNASVNAATGGSTQTPLTQDQINQATSAATAYGNMSGVSVNASDVQTLMQLNPGMTAGQAAAEAASIAGQKSTLTSAQQATAALQANQQTAFNAATAAQNAQYNDAYNQLMQSQQKAIGTATASLGALGSTTANSSAAQGLLAGINSQYAMAASSLNLQAAQATAALQAGNAQAYAAINANMQNTIASVNNNIQNILASSQQTQANVAQNATAQADKATAQYNTSLSTLTTASPLGSLFNSSGQPVAGAVTNPTFTNSSVYQQGTAAGMSPTAILGDVQNAVKTSKAADAQSTLSTDLLKAQIEAANSTIDANSKVLNSQLTDSISASTGTVANDGTEVNGSAYNNAISSISTAGKLTITQQNSLQWAVQTALAGGDTAQAKNAIKVAALSTLPPQDKQTVTGLETVATAASQVLKQIYSLPANEQTGFLNGNIQSLAAKYGQNPDPALQTISVQLNHLSNLYTANVFGKRAVLNGSGFINNIPDSKDGPSLVLSDISGLIDTSNDYLKGTLTSVMDPGTYDSIFNAPQSANTTTASGASFDYNAAVQAGYSPAQIKSYLAAN